MKIFKSIIISGSLLLSFYAAHTQPRLGVKGGLNMTHFSGDNINTSNLNRAVFGVFGEIPLTQNLSVSTEINYSNEGTGYNNGALEKTKVSYLEIPVLANIYLSNGMVRPKIFGGPSMSFLMDAENVYADGSKIKIDDSYKENKLGIVLGAGADVKITQENYLIFDIRYDLGVTEIEELSIGSFKNRGLRLNVGVSFPID
jgi:outer membrane protein W